MRDSQLNDFERRLQRIDQIHQAGGAFEASGSLGRSYFDSMRPKARRALSLRGLALIAAAALLVKGVMIVQIGAERYGAKVERLAQGSEAERIGAWVMRPGPLTTLIADNLRPILK
ncbi:hypothetical protein [Thioclava atlantica]|uniref:Uncharacterized protein n=1 Tax=Thioclava atlantica TaxID=1317124 RepID=A0A085TYI0_9RHOB|nr:hypothetical protein [Thioclava atlantica]KFE35777.1 hypothetical protein DW2_07433 [Thioclava atlantica]